MALLIVFSKWEKAESYTTVKQASIFSGYSQQYLRRLLRAGKLKGLKIGQLWLVESASFEAMINNANLNVDRRFGPRIDFASTTSQVEPRTKRLRTKLYMASIG